MVLLRTRKKRVAMAFVGYVPVTSSFLDTFSFKSGELRPCISARSSVTFYLDLGLSHLISSLCNNVKILSHIFIREIKRHPKMNPANLNSEGDFRSRCRYCILISRVSQGLFCFCTASPTNSPPSLPPSLPSLPPSLPYPLAASTSGVLKSAAPVQGVGLMTWWSVFAPPFRAVH